MAWPDEDIHIMQASLEVQQETPAYVTATATFLSMIYPNQGLDRCLTREHIERMDGRDFLKVMHVRPRLVSGPWAASCRGHLAADHAATHAVVRAFVGFCLCAAVPEQSMRLPASLLPGAASAPTAG